MQYLQGAIVVVGTYIIIGLLDSNRQTFPPYFVLGATSAAPPAPAVILKDANRQ